MLLYIFSPISNDNFLSRSFYLFDSSRLEPRAAWPLVSLGALGTRRDWMATERAPADRPGSVSCPLAALAAGSGRGGACQRLRLPPRGPRWTGAAAGLK